VLTRNPRRVDHIFFNEISTSSSSFSARA